MILLQKHPATVFNTKTVTESLFIFLSVYMLIIIPFNLQKGYVKWN